MLVLVSDEVILTWLGGVHQRPVELPFVLLGLWTPAVLLRMWSSRRPTAHPPTAAT
jgi:hypothetical protein